MEESTKLIEVQYMGTRRDSKGKKDYNYWHHTTKKSFCFCRPLIKGVRVGQLVTLEQTGGKTWRGGDFVERVVTEEEKAIAFRWDTEQSAQEAVHRSKADQADQYAKALAPIRDAYQFANSWQEREAILARVVRVVTSGGRYK